jgi:catechol 2,3-dioxygenase-like lactoylglutathione lyase family enzyme
MIHGAHIIIYSKDSEADRAFFRDVLNYKAVDAGHGWLIFALPPAEVAVHPSDENDVHELLRRCPGAHRRDEEEGRELLARRRAALGLDHAAYAARWRETRRLPAEACVADDGESDVGQVFSNPPNAQH